MNARARRGLAGMVAILPLAAMLVMVPALPRAEQVPTQWSSQYPDSFASGAGFLGVVITIVVVCAVAAALAGLLQRAVPQGWSRWLVTAAATVGWAAVGVTIVTFWRTSVDGAERVREIWPMVGLLLGIVLGIATYLLHGKRMPTAIELGDLVPERSRVQAIRGRAVRPVQPWQTEVSSRLLRGVGWGVLVIFAATIVAMFMTAQSGWMLAFLLLVGVGAGGLALAWSTVVVGVDEDGLTIRSSMLPISVLVLRVPCEQVAGAEAKDLNAMSWGGIGLRVLPGKTAYMVDAGGPSLVVYRSDGRQLGIRIPEGESVAQAGARTLLQAAGQARQ